METVSTEKGRSVGPKARYKYYVSLDLGSASSAAFYQVIGESQGRGMVELQAHAYELLGEDPAYLHTDGTVSPRLKTRFILREYKQPAPLEDEHALLDFIDAEGMRLYVEDDDGEEYEIYQDSIFEFFSPLVQQEEFIELRMPNPKIPFQMGGRDVIPSLGLRGAQSSRKHKYEPAELIKHMTLQMVRNFVLRSPQLARAFQEEPDQIHLTLTVPNVYSLTHAQDILAFVKRTLPVGEVEFLFESDAVAYAFLARNLGRPLDANRREMISKLGALQLENAERRLVTIDVGRGTTDLSLIRLETKDSPQGPQTWHCVLARTGRSDGGNKLSHIFARYFNTVLQQQNAFFRQQTEQDLPFDLLHTRSVDGTPSADQRLVINDLEGFIEAIKESITSKYEVTLEAAEQAQYIRKITKYLLKAFPAGWEANNPSKADVIYQHLVEVLTLPPKQSLLPRFKYMPASLRRRLSRKSTDDEARAGALEKLGREVLQYVNDTVALFDELKLIAREREGKTDEKVRIFDSKNTFVLVAGQASQFKPLRRAIQAYCASSGLPTQFLEKDEAKEACCRGAVSYHLTRYRFENPYELHGTYGFISQAAGDRIKLIPTAALKSGEPVIVEVDSGALHTLVYLTHPASPEEIEAKYKGYVAQISQFEPVYGDLGNGQAGYHLAVVYNQSTAEFKVKDIRVREVGSFGLLTDDIFEKVWPDILRPLEETL